MLGAMRVLSWGAAPHEGRAMLRPDGQWQLRLPEDQTGWPALLATLPAEITTAVLALGEGHAATVLPSFGFAAVRTEQLVTETDITNRDSHSLAAHHGAVPRGRTVEWVLQTRTGR